MIAPYEIVCELENEWKVTPFEEGKSGCAYILEKGETKCALKLLDPSCPTSESMKEVWISQLAAEKGVGPKILSYNLEKRYIIMEYVEGFHPYIYDGTTMKPAVLELKTLHSQLRYEPFSGIYERYEQLLNEDSMFAKHFKKAIETVYKMEKIVSGKFTICHNDFHSKNIIIEDAKAKILDWSSCSFGHPYYDVAKLAYHLEDDEALQLFETYLEREPTPCETTHFKILRSIVHIARATNQLVRGNKESSLEALCEFYQSSSEL